jgi:hypothetical protein
LQATGSSGALTTRLKDGCFYFKIRLKKHLEWLALRRPNPLIPEDHGNIVGLLVTAGTSLAATVDTFYHLLLPEVLGDPAHARGGEVVISCLYASEAAKALITRLHIHKNIAMGKNIKQNKT